MSDREDALRAIEQEISVLFRRARRVIGERARQVHPELPASAYLILAHTRDNGPLRPAGLCVAFDIDKGAISRQVQHLVDLGLIDRTPDPDDRRATLIQLSAEGARRMSQVVASRREGFEERLSDWSEADLSAFAAVLTRYNASLAPPG